MTHVLTLPGLLTALCVLGSTFAFAGSSTSSEMQVAQVKNESPSLRPERNADSALRPERNADSALRPERNADSALRPERNADSPLRSERNAESPLSPHCPNDQANSGDCKESLLQRSK
jgi:hypothetical protein